MNRPLTLIDQSPDICLHGTLSFVVILMNCSDFTFQHLMKYKYTSIAKMIMMMS
jgi:hypothetical protein